MLDPSVIIETKEDDGRPKRRATRRNYVFDDLEDVKLKQQLEIKKENTSQLLQKIKTVVDSDSEYEGDEPDQSNSNGNNNSENPSECNVTSETSQIPANTEDLGQMAVLAPVQDHHLVQSPDPNPVTVLANVNELPSITQCTTDVDHL